jgi:hypothetical protein
MNNSRSELYPLILVLPLSYYEKNTKNAEGKASHHELGFQNNHLAKEKAPFFRPIPDYYKPTSQFGASRSVKNPN